jgi:hypothetical protein
MYHPPQQSTQLLHLTLLGTPQQNINIRQVPLNPQPHIFHIQILHLNLQLIIHIQVPQQNLLQNQPNIIILINLQRLIIITILIKVQHLLLDHYIIIIHILRMVS